MSARHSVPSQALQILLALQRGMSLTPKDARQLYHCDRLGARIYELRKEGHQINRRLVLVSGKKRVAEYSMDLPTPAP